MHRQRIRWQARAAIYALVGLVIGVIVGLAAPLPTHYQAEARVALLPAANLSIADSSSYWEVLSRGQVPHTAAVVYGDAKWLQSAASAANVGPSDLTLTAGPMPDTTLVLLTVDAPSAAAAQSALSDVLAKATPEVAALSAPFTLRVVATPEGNTTAIGPQRLQVVVVAGVIGLLIGLGAYFAARRLIKRSIVVHSSPVEPESLPVST
ncbi:MAG: hypothetical protein ABW137_13880 [Mycobacterium sp.]